MIELNNKTRYDIRESHSYAVDYINVADIRDEKVRDIDSESLYQVLKHAVPSQILIRCHNKVLALQE